MKISLALLLSITLCAHAFAQAAGNPLGQVTEGDLDKLFGEWNAGNTPGGVVGVMLDGDLVFQKGYGLADLEHHIPNQPSTVFYLGSTGKQFTAFSILLLEEQGKLSLDDEIQKYLPDFPQYDAPITIRHLVHHTSGIRDYSSLWILQGRSYMERISAEATYRMLQRQSALNFTPGAEYLYSNSGYFLLSEIVEKVSGQSLKDFASQHIFDPLGMKQTLLLDDVRDLVEDRAFAYYAKEDGPGFENAIRRFELVGAGGVYSTISDLHKWDRNFYNNKLGKGGQAIIEKMYSQGRLGDGTPFNYAFGLETDFYNGLRMFDHGGSHGGFKAQFRRFPDQRLSVIVLANRSDANVDGLSLRIVDLFLNDLYQSGQAEAVRNMTSGSSGSIAMDTDALKRLTGHYLFRDGTVRQVTVRSDALFYGQGRSNQDALVPIASGEFRFSRPQSSGFIRKRAVHFGETEEGTVTVSYIVDGRVADRGFRFEPATYTSTELRRFTGSYFSSDLDTTYRLKLEGDELVMIVGDERRSSLTVIAEDILRSNDYGLLRFELGADQEVAGFTLDASRVRGLRFVKLAVSQADGEYRRKMPEQPKLSHGV